MNQRQPIPVRACNEHGVPFEYLLTVERRLNHVLSVRLRNTVRLCLAALESPGSNSKERAKLRQLAREKARKVLA